MIYRSTNPDGRFVHFGGDIISNVESSHGVELGGGSTGGVVRAVGGDANIALTVTGKGTGGVQLGAASTSPMAMIQRHLIQWTVPALSSAGLNASFGDSTITLTGATTNSLFLVNERANLNSTESTGIFISRVRCSTANELRITVANGGASTISGSTMSAYVVQLSF